MIWNKKEISAADVKQLAEKYKIDLISASIIVRRGLPAETELKYILENDLLHSHSPFLFVEMEDAVERILQGIEENEKIMVYGDRDVDGITSTVLLYEALSGAGADCSWRVPSGNESYGLSMQDIDDFSANGITLLITVDCGISNKDEIALAVEKGIDVIVTDHHLPPEELPEAIAIINPKIEESGYPFINLAGCAVVSKLVWALEFARTSLYNQTVCLLNCIPGNDSIVIEAIKLHNLVEVDRVREILVQGMTSLDHPRLQSFLVGQELLVFNAEQQTNMLRKVFGRNVDIGLTDIRSRVFQAFPALQDWSLFKMIEKSRYARYLDGKSAEIEMLRFLFISIIFAANPNLESSLRTMIDLVSLGTLADLMPLADENRLIVRRGLEALGTTGRIGLRELLFCQNLQGKKISAVDVSWQLAPVINATGRFGVPEKAVELLLCSDRQKAALLVQEVIDINRQRRNLGEQVWEKIQDRSRQSYDEYHSKLVVVDDREMPRGITGIIANRLVNYFKVPAIVLSFFDNKVVGSMRSVAGINAKDFLESMQDIFNDHGGHEMAAGFNLPEQRYDEFRQRLAGQVAEMKIPEEGEESLNIDAEIPHKFMNPDLIKIVDMFEPYGEGNEQLMFLLRQAVIDDISLMGKSEPQHVRMTVSAGEHKWPAVFWKASDKVGVLLDNGKTVDLVFTLGRNFYQNNETLQLTIVDVSA
ncbi:MAG: single-stranded-DNA-specific exonuclease RecJ [Spirochaetales bacterium]|nr:single-stranded-DNA-specific exonuclease RecJ [Spirochaetales bacterium]